MCSLACLGLALPTLVCPPRLFAVAATVTWLEYRTSTPSACFLALCVLPVRLVPKLLCDVRLRGVHACWSPSDCAPELRAAGTYLYTPEGPPVFPKFPQDILYPLYIPR